MSIKYTYRQRVNFTLLYYIDRESCKDKEKRLCIRANVLPGINSPFIARCCIL